MRRTEPKMLAPSAGRLLLPLLIRQLALLACLECVSAVNLERNDMVDISDFYRLVVNDLFVDKSSLIDYYLKRDERVICVTRPRGWGKSTNLSMLKRFFELEVDEKGQPIPSERSVNRKLFSGGEVLGDDGGPVKNVSRLQIVDSADSMKHQGRYPVVYLSFSRLTSACETSDQVKDRVRNVTAQLFDSRAYLMNGLSGTDRTLFEKYRTGRTDDEELTAGLKRLTSFLFKHHGQKTVVLIDDYDVPFVGLYVKLVRRRQIGDAALADVFEQAPQSTEFESTLEFVRSFYQSVMQRNDEALYRAFMTGTFEVPLGNIGFDKLVRYSVQDPDFVAYYGFSEAEVDRMLTNVSFRTDRDDVRRWYGHDFGEQVTYNALSIRRYIANGGKFQAYWTEERNHSLADLFFATDDMQRKLHDLVDGKAVSCWISRQINFHDMPEWSVNYLVFSGYLKPKSFGYSDKPLTIPNREVADALQTKISAWVHARLNISQADFFQQIADSLQSFKIKVFQRRMESVLPKSSVPAIYYKGIMTCLLRCMNDNFVRLEQKVDNAPGPNVILIGKTGKQDGAIVMKYKAIKNRKKLRHEVENEMKRIDDRMASIAIDRYEHIKRVLKIALIFCGDLLSLEYQVKDV